MRASRLAWVVLALIVQSTFAHGAIITLKTGQSGSGPGSCPGPDSNFRCWAPQSQCAQPILPTAFTAADFDSACSGPLAAIVDAYPLWAPDLPCDPDARWIANSVEPGSCYGSSLSVLYCAPFSSDCAMADSVVVCWEVDDYLGDPAGLPGPNPDGIYINGVTLGPQFDGGSRLTPTTAVAYNVPLNTGLNSFEVYQRDGGCAVAGIILSAKVYTHCGTTPVQEGTWGSIKSLYR